LFLSLPVIIKSVHPFSYYRRLHVRLCFRLLHFLFQVPIDRIFPKTLRDKFVWALSVPPDWEFEAMASKKK
jgi:hypothetical protein